MTTYNSREMPHPVLKPGGRDYQKESGFSAKVDMRRMPDVQQIAIGVQYELGSEGLHSLIQSEKAQYQTLVQCVNTRTRQTHRTTKNMHRFDLDSQEYHGVLDLLPMVIATQETSLNMSDWSDTIRSILPNGTTVPTGAILAIANRQVFDLSNEPEYASLIDIVPSPNTQPNQFKVNLEGERIAIQINPDDRLKIERIRRDEDQVQKLFPSAYLSAIDKAVRAHQDDEHQDKRWAIRISQKLAEHELDVDCEILQENSLDYAQVIMDSPLGRIIEPPQIQDED